MKLRSPALVVFLAVFLAGTATNIHNSGQDLTGIQDAKDRIVESFKNIESDPITQDVYEVEYNQ